MHLGWRHLKIRTRRSVGIIKRKTDLATVFNAGFPRETIWLCKYTENGELWRSSGRDNVKLACQNLIRWIMFSNEMAGKPGLMRRQTSFGHNCCLPETVFPKVGLQTLGHRFAGCMCVCWGRWVPGSKKSGRHGQHATLPSWGITVHTAPDRLWATLQWRKLVTVWPRTFSFQSTQWRHQESQVILECRVSPSS